ncbi:MAG: formylglycine-generating enzyme family protein [Treponema sp.]|jgi:formylglycine-generating enzyme required for sulfatase activity|nr:formylglycine-generating enzyme family protein [Treponema sp.]
MKKFFPLNWLAAAALLAAFAAFVPTACDNDIVKNVLDSLPSVLPEDSTDFFVQAPALATGTDGTAPGAVIGSFAAGFDYSLASAGSEAAIPIDRDNDKFVIEGAELKVGEEPLGSGAYYILIQARKDGSAILITVNFYVAEAGGPTDFEFMPEEGMMARTIKAKKGGTAGRFTPPDGGNAPYSWVLAAGNGVNDADNGSFEIRDDKLAIKKTLAEGRDYRVYVRIVDSAQKIYQKEIDVSVAEYSIPDAKHIDDEMVTVIDKETTVTGSADYAIQLAGDNARTCNLFVAGRSLTFAPYKMSKYEITYGQWYEVAQWATADARGEKKYTFANKGTAFAIGGKAGEAPATDDQRYAPAGGVNWRDIVVWCNALSEYNGKEPVYYYIPESDISVVARNSTGSNPTTSPYKLCPIDAVTMDKTKTGYRLPVEAEWEFAARGGDTSKPDWMYRWAGTNDMYEVFNYAVTTDEAIVENATTKHPLTVGSRKPNRLGLYDMTGNVGEYCWDWAPSTSVSTLYNAVASNLSIDGLDAPTSSTPGIVKMVRGLTYGTVFQGGSSTTMTVVKREALSMATSGAAKKYGFRIVSKG